MSSKKQLALIFVLIALATGIIIGFIVNSVITNRVVYETQERVKEALNTARWVYDSKLNDIDRTIRLTSIRYVLREALKKEKAIFIKDDLARGHRAVGTRAMKEVQEHVLQSGASWMQRAYVVDDWYITAYEPIHDFQGKIVGMLYVGILETKYTVLKERLILLFMFGMLVSVAVSSFLSLKILKKEFWENIRSGQKQ